jgi:citrate lyase subunit beta / citryl-CoA lyase
MTKLTDKNALIRRNPELRRSWLFVPGADEMALKNAVSLGADVVIQELEDFTLPGQRPLARELSIRTFASWQAAGLLAAVRINPLETDDGPRDLRAAMAGRPDIVLLPKTVSPTQISRLDEDIGQLELLHGMDRGSTEIVPNLETAAGLVGALDIAKASPRVTAMLVASEDMAADLGAERSREGVELQYVRSRFLVDCVAAGVVAIDCPYTFSDLEGVRADTLAARRLGYTAKSIVAPEHVAIVNGVLTPGADELAAAEKIAAAFDRARAMGYDRAEVDGHVVEVPTYHTALRLIARATALADVK